MGQDKQNSMFGRISMPNYSSNSKNKFNLFE